jgi:hypothetical protein
LDDVYLRHAGRAYAVDDGDAPPNGTGKARR